MKYYPTLFSGILQLIQYRKIMKTNCKNCQENLTNISNFCPNCGAKIVNERISVKSLWTSFAKDFFGWDNKYLFTLKSLLLYPERVFNSYINGVRKRYVSPFIFLAIGTALAMLIFNQYATEYIELSKAISEKEFELIGEQFESSIDMETFEKEKEEQVKMSEETQGTILKFFNLFTFFLIPFYTSIAYLVFGKRYNYAEHLVIACYTQGFLFITAILFFGLSLAINPAIYGFSILVMIVYYLYAYGRLYNLSKGKLVVKLLKFLGVILLFLVGSFLLGILVGFLRSKFG